MRLNGGDSVKVEHETDLYARFPDFKGFTFDTNFCDRVIQDDRDAYDDLEGMWDLNEEQTQFKNCFEQITPCVLN